MVALGVAADDDDALLVGRLSDAQGLPLVQFRVVARVVDAATVFVSPPSDDRGNYKVELPSGATYELVAVLSPGGKRIPLAEETVVDIGDTPVTRDLTIGIELVPSPRAQLFRGEDGLGRFYLQLVEDPEIARGYYAEAGLAAMEHDDYDRRELRALFAFRPIPRVELGVRGGWADLDAGALDDSGVMDTDAWGKLELHRTPTGRAAVTAGALLTFPTADADAGLGNDALQSKLFVSGSWTGADIVLAGHVGARATEGATVGGVSREGRTAFVAGLGVLVPLWDRLFVTFEARHEGERFEGLDPDARASAGVSWRPPLPRAVPGVLRSAIAFGLDDGAPDTEIQAGWAVGF
jgi:hypothetical protein